MTRKTSHGNVTHLPGGSERVRTEKAHGAKADQDSDSARPPDSTSRVSAGPTTDNEAPRVEEMLLEDGGVVEPRVPVEAHRSTSDELNGAQVESSEFGSSEFRSTAVRPQGKIQAFLEDLSQYWGTRRLSTLVRKKGRVSKTMKVVPDSMHRVANQSRLVLELIDDFRDGTYREISWRSIALLTAGILYSVNPGDVIPDAVPILGQLDDLVLLAVVTRLTQGDLRKYCRFRGYEERHYFRPVRGRGAEWDHERGLDAVPRGNGQPRTA